MSEKANSMRANTDANCCNSLPRCHERLGVSKQFLRLLAAEVTESKRQNWGYKQVTVYRGETAMKMHMILSCCTVGEALCI